MARTGQYAYHISVPRKTEWIHRIPRALELLRQSPAPLIDRRDLEQLLQVSGRHALRLFHRLGAAEAGRNLFLAREELIRRLESIRDGEDARWERRRLERLGSELSETARSLRARRVPVETAAGQPLFASLPLSVRLAPGRLEIDFQTPEELLTRLYELSQALANDYEGFEGLLARASSEPGAALPV